MCEDCHTSYVDSELWPDGGLRREETFIEFMKKIIDEINFPYSCSGNVPPTYNTHNLSGLHFYDSIVVAEKKTRPFKPFPLRIGEAKIDKSGYVL